MRLGYLCSIVGITLRLSDIVIRNFVIEFKPELIDAEAVIAQLGER